MVATLIVEATMMTAKIATSMVTTRIITAKIATIFINSNSTKLNYYNSNEIKNCNPNFDLT